MSIHPYETVHRMKAAMAIPSIGAIATQKIPSDALNLGFPSAYQSVYAAFIAPKHAPAYFSQPERPMRGFDYIGTDLQADYHASKKAEADKMAAAKVKSTQTSRVRYVSTPHGRGILPPDVLAQRKFANQSNGALSATSARRDQSGAPFSTVESNYVGGVLRSPAGQRYGQALLQQRIGQLDAIQQATQDFGPMGSIVQRPRGDMTAETQLPTENEATAVELNLLLEGVLNALTAADVASTGTEGGDQLSRFTLSDATRALLLIFRLVPTSSTEFAEDLMGKVDAILQLLSGALDEDQESAGLKVEAKQIALTLQILFTKLRTYLVRMMGGNPVERTVNVFNPLTQRQESRRVVSQEQGANLSPKERLALSKSLVRDLGFSKMLKKNESVGEVLDAAARGREMNAQQRQRFEEGDMDDDEEDDDDRHRPMVAGRDRENAQHAAQGGPRRGERRLFDPDEREAYGRNQGVVDGIAGVRGVNAFAGEEGDGPAIDAADEFGEGEAGAAAGPRAAPEPRGAYDPLMEGYDVLVPRAADAAPAAPAGMAAPADARPQALKDLLPNRRMLPNTNAGFQRLAARLREAGIPIRVAVGSEVKNIKKNFITRFNIPY